MGCQPSLADAIKMLTKSPMAEGRWHESAPDYLDGWQRGRWNPAVEPSGQVRVPGTAGGMAGNLEPPWEVLSKLSPNWGVPGHVLLGKGWVTARRGLGHVDRSFAEALKC